MYNTQVMKQALDALRFALHVGFDESSESQIKKGDKAVRQHQDAIAALRTAIEQAETAAVQEPVAIVVAAHYEDGSHAGHRLEWRGRNEANDFPEGTEFYTTPPAAPVQEPVIHKYTLELPDGDIRKAKVFFVNRKANGAAIQHDLCIKVDPSSAQRRPLTEDQIQKASLEARMQEHYMGFHSGFIRFARAIEQAHGIAGESK